MMNGKKAMLLVLILLGLVGLFMTVRMFSGKPSAGKREESSEKAQEIVDWAEKEPEIDQRLEEPNDSLAADGRETGNKQGIIMPITELACLNREPMPEGIAFQVMINGTLFTTSGKADLLTEVGMKGNYLRAGTHYGVMPKGYEKYGSIQSVVKEVPKRELEMSAGADLTGDVYLNPDCPDVVYAYLNFSWIDDKEPFCYRFVSERICDDQCVFYNGYLYQNTFEDCDEASEGVTYVGKLNFTGIDRVPQNDLETNNSNWSKIVYNGKEYESELYVLENDEEVIYVKEIRYGNKKDYWIKCRKTMMQP